MKFLVSCALALAFVQICAGENEEGVCYSNIQNFCDRNTIDSKCDSKFGGISFQNGDGSNDLLDKLNSYSQDHVQRSFEYLLLATHFSNAKTERPGFESLYRGYSDAAWEHAIDLIKFISKRGGHGEVKAPQVEGTYELEELKSLSKAVDIQKDMVEKAFDIHRTASDGSVTGVQGTASIYQKYDPEVASYIENEFVHKQADSVRTLVGHVHDLQKMIEHSQVRHVATFMFDEYLQGL